MAIFNDWFGVPQLTNPNAHIINPELEAEYNRAPKGLGEAMWQGAKQTVANLGDASGDFRNRPADEAIMNAVIMNRDDFISDDWRKVPTLLNPSSQRVDSVDPLTWVMPGDAVNNTSGNQYLGFPARDRRVEPGAQMHPSEAAMVSSGRDPGQSTPVVQQAATAAKSVTPASLDPVQHLADKNDQAANVTPPRDTSMDDARSAIFKDIGQTAAYEQEELEPWYESPTFYRGLISFGLNLLSGNDLGASFNAAGNYYDQERGREQRELWRDDMLADGYNAMEVQRYIDTGDNRVLTDPMERAAQIAQLQSAELDLGHKQFRNKYMEEDRQLEIDKAKREEERQARKDALSERLTQSSIAENEAQTAKALGLVAGGELGSGDLNKPIGKETADSRKARNLWNRSRGQYIAYLEEYGQGGGADMSLFDELIHDAGIGENTKTDMSTWDKALSKMNPEKRAQLEDQMSIVTQILRGDSGAAIAASEYRNALHTYFGRRGNSPERIASKEKELVAAIEMMNPKIGDALVDTLIGRHLLQNLTYDLDGSVVAIDKDGNGMRFR